MNQQSHADSLILLRDVAVPLERIEIARRVFDDQPRGLLGAERVPMLPWPSRLYDDVVTQ